MLSELFVKLPSAHFFFSSFKKLFTLSLSSVCGRDMFIIRISFSPNFVILRGIPDSPIVESQEDNYHYIIPPTPPPKKVNK